MDRYSLSHLSDRSLLEGLTTLVAKDRATTAALLAHIGEVDARKLYLPAAYPSMFEYCVRELKLSEDAAAKRIQVARMARRFPVVLAAIDDGRLHLTGAGLLAPHLTGQNVADLVSAATHRSKTQIEKLLADRFPRPDLATFVRPIPVSATPAELPEHAPAHVVAAAAPGADPPAGVSQHAPAHAEHPTQATDGDFQRRFEHAPAHVVPASMARVTPLSPERFAIQVTVGRSTHEKLVRAGALLSHQISPRDVEQILDRALDALISRLEKHKYAATTRPRPARASSVVRTIPAHVRRAVRERDGDQCTFVSDTGQRCPARERLEFDHVLEVARGGATTVAGVRLRCRAHNQFTAERTFGAGFMHEKRQRAVTIRPAGPAHPQAVNTAAGA